MKKRIRAYIWLLTGIINRYYKTILIISISAILFIIFGIKFSPLFVQKLKTEHKVIGMVGSFTPVNLPFSIQRLISSGLTDIQINGEVIPAIAKSWQISDDGKTYIFSLRSDLIWHDGQKFRPEDVNYNLKDVEFIPETDNRLIIKLKNSFTPLPNVLSKPIFKKGLIGLGAYKIDNIKLKGEYVTYLKLMPLASELAQIEYKFYPNETLAKTAFKLGEVNVLDEIDDPTPFTGWKNITVNKNIMYNRFVGIFFNTNDQLLKNKEIRQGLSFAVSKPEINRIATPLSVKSWAYTNRVKQYEKDIQQAKNLLADISSSESAEITLSTFNQFYQQAQIISSEWEAVGIKTKIKLENGLPENFQALLITQEIPSDPDQYSFWHSTQNATNISGYANAKIDKLLEDGRKEPDKEQRQKIYYDFQRYLVDDAPAIFLYHPETYTIIRK